MTTTILQPDATHKDAYIRSTAATTNNGASGSIHVGYSASYGINRYLSQFDLSSIPVGATIISAIYSININSVSATTSYNCYAHNITQSWLESSVTWDTQPTFDASSVASVSIGDIGWYEFDITSLVAGWCNGSITNNGLILKMATADETGTSRKTGASSDYTTDTSQRPKLTITYTVGGVDGTITLTVGNANLNTTSSTLIGEYNNQASATVGNADLIGMNTNLTGGATIQTNTGNATLNTTTANMQELVGLALITTTAGTMSFDTTTTTIIGHWKEEIKSLDTLALTAQGAILFLLQNPNYIPTIKEELSHGETTTYDKLETDFARAQGALFYLLQRGGV